MPSSTALAREFSAHEPTLGDVGAESLRQPLRGNARGMKVRGPEWVEQPLGRPDRVRPIERSLADLEWRLGLGRRWAITSHDWLRHPQRGMKADQFPPAHCPTLDRLAALSLLELFIGPYPVVDHEEPLAAVSGDIPHGVALPGRSFNHASNASMSAMVNGFFPNPGKSSHAVPSSSGSSVTPRSGSSRGSGSIAVGMVRSLQRV